METMSIPIGAYDHPQVRAACEQANDLVERWITAETSGGDSSIALHVLGWTRVALGDAIAVLLLTERRWYIEDIEQDLDQGHDADVLGAWRARP